MYRFAAVALALAACSSDGSLLLVEHGWMSRVDGDLPLTALSIPGTHETLALYEPLKSTAKCQDLSLAAQLEAGVRYIDVRCRHMDDAFAIYHGAIFQQQQFADVLATIEDFLDRNPSETILMSVKEESVAEGATRSFEATFASYVEPQRWYLGTTLPTLEQARGKIVLVRRFAAEAQLGIDASAWPDNTTFSNDASQLRVQDAYVVDATANKWAAIASLLDEARGDVDTLFLNYTSGYLKPGALPDILGVANAINPQLDAYLGDHVDDHLGVVVMDFATETRALRIAARNERLEWP